jgi:TPR repeat protein
MKAIPRSVFLALAIVALVVPVNAGPFEDGEVAYEKSDYAAALRFWLPLAEQGDAEAQFKLGVMHYEGWGVPWDIVQAHMWLRLAAAQDNYSLAQKYRDIVASRLLPDQIAEAERMAREWMAKHQR